jgi:hypothetical protein
METPDSPPGSLTGSLSASRLVASNPGGLEWRIQANALIELGLGAKIGPHKRRSIELSCLHCQLTGSCSSN